MLGAGLLALAWTPLAVRAAHQDTGQGLGQGTGQDIGQDIGQELLEPDQAFRFEAQMASLESLRVTWHIAGDYYMYRRSFSVGVVGDGPVLGAPELPPGKSKHDENFGDVEIYDSDVSFTVPVESVPAGADQFVIQAVGQGCNEPVGVCYPPVTRTETIRLAAAPPAGGQSLRRDAAGESSGGAGVLDSLSAILGGGSNDTGGREFLDPDQAFTFKVSPAGPDRVLAQFSIAPGYYLYKDKLAVESESPGVAVAGVSLPEGRKKTDQYFGEIHAFYDDFQARIALTRDAAKAGDVSLKLKYQGCAEDGICYPPIEKNVSLRLPGLSDAAAAGPAGPPATAGLGSGLWPLLLAFGSGLLLTFTPCVLPMVPILAGIIVGQGSTVTRLRGGGLASVYVLGTAVTYTAVGVVAGLTGDQLQAYFQNAWAIGVIAALLVFMALSMFGLYELKVPSSVQTRLQHHATGLKAGAFGGVFLMGMLSAMIVGACVSPILISILGLAINRGDPVLGGAIMFSMALGMGLLLIALGFGFGHFLPRTGAWMETVKHAFGVMLLAVAVYLLGAIPEVPVMYLWAALLVGTAVYLGVSRTHHAGGAWHRVRQASSMALVAWGVLALIGGLQGNRDILAPLDYQALVAGGGAEPAARADFQRVSDPEALGRLMRSARAEGKPVMIDYYADWCVDCLRLQRATFSAPRVAQALNDEFVLIQVDVTDPKDPDTRAIKRAHDVFGPPAMLFFDARGNEVRSLRRYGYMDSEEFLRHIQPLRQG